MNIKTAQAVLQPLCLDKGSGRPTRHLISGLAISLSLSLVVSGKAEAAAFNFTLIADTNDLQFTSFAGGAPAINDSGTVAFQNA